MNNVVSLPRKTIAHGRNAGKPACSADMVMDNLTAAKDVAARLKRNGFTVISAAADTQIATVAVQQHAMCAQLIADGQAGYYLMRAGEKHGEFYGEANDGRRVRVVWVEGGGH